MFKKVLIPVDGSDLALRAAATGVQLAKEVNAQVVFLHAMAPYIAPYAAEISMVDDKAQAMFEQSVTAGSNKVLADAKKLADAAGVVSESVHAVASRPESFIDKTVREKNCDLVVIATHGRGAVGRFVMGSVTTRLLPISSVPVLVYRDETMTKDVPA
ncbi:MAG: universal stress protein [Burkholderiales bacterium]|nr:universal stress protein [Burkholderiales bacterium]